MSTLEILYEIFAGYSSEDLELKNGWCNYDQDYAQMLKMTHLRVVEGRELRLLFDSSTFPTGDIAAFKYYLPRYFEAPEISLWELFDRLESLNWKEWDRTEIKAIEDYVISDWLSGYPSSDFADYLGFFSVSILVDLWGANPKFLKKSVTDWQEYNSFLADYWNYTQTNAVSDADQNAIFALLEESYWEYINIEPGYAADISQVMAWFEYEQNV